jgi:flavodoxin
MKIGIIIYSHTGHTLSAAVALKEKLSAAGHAVNLERVEIFGPDGPGVTNVSLKTKPRTDTYDALVFGSPVRGGAMPPAMTNYLEQVTSLQDKKVAFLVTHFFPPEWGANQTISQMKAICESKGATVCGWGDVGWPRLGLKRRVTEAVDHLESVLGDKR